jgi:septal ring factor EnvC (AmiA/AmiB activator)
LYEIFLPLRRFRSLIVSFALGALCGAAAAGIFTGLYINRQQSGKIGELDSWRGFHMKPESNTFKEQKLRSFAVAFLIVDTLNNNETLNQQLADLSQVLSERELSIQEQEKLLTELRTQFSEMSATYRTLSALYAPSGRLSI